MPWCLHYILCDSFRWLQHVLKTVETLHSRHHPFNSPSQSIVHQETVCSLGQAYQNKLPAQKGHTTSRMLACRRILFQKYGWLYLCNLSDNCDYGLCTPPVQRRSLVASPVIHPTQLPTTSPTNQQCSASHLPTTSGCRLLSTNTLH